LLLVISLLVGVGLGLFEPGVRVGVRSISSILSVPVAYGDHEGDNVVVDNDDDGDNDDDDDGDNDDDDDNNDNDDDDDNNDNDDDNDDNDDDGDNDDGDNDDGDNDDNFDDDNFEDNGSEVIVIVVTPTPFATPIPTVAPRPSPAAVAPTNAAQTSVPQGPCFFVLGFADLHRTLNGRDGNCTDNEHPDPNGTGDMVQGTNKDGVPGYMVWQKSTNTMRWTNGYETFTYSKCLLQQRLNTQTFNWERNPDLLNQPGETPPPGACNVA
jgi:hypothetical protein